MLATKFEATAQAVNEDLKNFIVAELDKRFAQMEVRFAQVESRIAQVEMRFERSLRIQMATILSAFVGVTTLAVAIIKLF